MTLFIFFLILLIITGINLYLCKKVYAPPVVLGLVFLVSYIILNATYGKLENEYSFYGCFVIATIAFSIGFYLTGNKTKMSPEPVNYIIYLKNDFFKLFLIIEYIIAIVEMSYMIPILRQMTGNAWHSIRQEYEGSELLDFLNLYILMFIILNISVLLINRNKQSIRRFLITLPAILPVVLCANRGLWFMLIICICFLMLFIYRVSNMKTVKIAGLVIIILFSLILISSVWKYSDYFDSYDDIFKMVSKSYFSTQFVAFREKMEWIQAGHGRLGMGENTFRFFVAIGHSLGFAQEPVDIVQRFVNIYGYNTNVYTGLSYYATDFGMWWAYFIEFILGMIYGYLFKRVFRKQTDWIFGIIALSILMYPLINQFFDDRYFSVLSQWLKQFFFLWIFTRKNVLIIDKGTNDYEK